MAQHQTECEQCARLKSINADLLEACEAFLRLFMDSDMRPEDECHDVASVVRAAIAKAKGI